MLTAFKQADDVIIAEVYAADALPEAERLDPRRLVEELRAVELDERSRTEQRLVQSPQMIQAMQILQCPMMELRDQVEHELQENVFLEVKEDTEREDPRDAWISSSGKPLAELPGGSVVGMGWSLAMPNIERTTARGLPDYDLDDDDDGIHHTDASAQSALLWLYRALDTGGIR